MGEHDEHEPSALRRAARRGADRSAPESPALHMHGEALTAKDKNLTPGNTSRSPAKRA